ncbi:transglycosylase SLT domain-containing protein [Tropicimonas marinistellae]|uniref:transglycosylase SLT domain-containing protein n=1 Tax=Tropicimonas marinistellae TaxID=1739787 RepID=UPI0008320E1D|nr:transglycosylase SLT domain-containing protein [Tropicimonas marinistellae]
MSRLICALCVVMALAGCGGGNKVSPRNLDNACSIADQRPKYLRAMRKTERKWGVPVPVQMAVIHQESRFDGDARTPLQWKLGVIPMGRQSSAYGYSQALDATWDQYKSETRNRGARRDNIRDATDFMGWYMNKTREKNGIPLTDARRQYLAYHEGWNGYARGSYRSKTWLVNVAGNVGERAVLYDRQLRSCGKI